MSNPLSHPENPGFHSSIQENLKQLSAQLGSPLDELSVMEIYQNACNTTEPRFSITSYSCPRCRNITRLQVKDTELEEFEWFCTQVKQCLDEEEVEELIESIHRTDAL